MKRTLFLACALASLPACAGEVEMRSVARQSGAILSEYRSSVREFAAGQNALNAANESRLDQLVRLKEMREAEIGARVSSWRLGNDERALSRFAVIGETGVDEVLAAAEPRLRTAPPPALEYKSEEIDAIIKQLVQLQKPVTPGQRLGDLLAFGTALRERYQANLAAAGQEAGEAAQDTAASAAATETDEARAAGNPPSQE